MMFSVRARIEAKDVSLALLKVAKAAKRTFRLDVNQHDVIHKLHFSRNHHYHCLSDNSDFLRVMKM